MSPAHESAIDSPAVLSWRIGVAEKLVANLDTKKADKEYVDTIAEEVKGLRKAVVGAALAVMGSAVLVSLTLFATLGSHIAGG